MMSKKRLKESLDEGWLAPPGTVTPDQTKNTASRITIGSLLDASGSMDRNRAMEEAWKGSLKFEDEVLKDEVLAHQLDYAFDCFSDRRIPIKSYGSVLGWEPRKSLKDLPRGSSTHLGEAMLEHFAALQAHLDGLRERDGLSVRGSLVMVITDAENNGDPAAFDEACRRARAMEKRHNMKVLGVGVEGADMEELARLAPEPVKLASVESFRQFYRWLLVTGRQISCTKAGESIALPDPYKRPGNDCGFAERWSL